MDDGDSSIVDDSSNTYSTVEIIAGRPQPLPTVKGSLRIIWLTIQPVPAHHQQTSVRPFFQHLPLNGFCFVLRIVILLIGTEYGNISCVHFSQKALFIAVNPIFPSSILCNDLSYKYRLSSAIQMPYSIPIDFICILWYYIVSI